MPWPWQRKPPAQTAIIPADPPTTALTRPDDSARRKLGREMIRRAGGDSRYTPHGLAQALDMPAKDTEARMNAASIYSIPDGQISEKSRQELAASALRGEDTYAYPPRTSLIEGDIEGAQWNVWYRNTRIPIGEFEARTGRIVEDRPAAGVLTGRDPYAGDPVFGMRSGETPDQRSERISRRVITPDEGDSEFVHAMCEHGTRSAFVARHGERDLEELQAKGIVRLDKTRRGWVVRSIHTGRTMYAGDWLDARLLGRLPPEMGGR